VAKGAPSPERGTRCIATCEKRAARGSKIVAGGGRKGRGLPVQGLCSTFLMTRNTGQGVLATGKNFWRGGQSNEYGSRGACGGERGKTG